MLRAGHGGQAEDDESRNFIDHGELGMAIVWKENNFLKSREHGVVALFRALDFQAIHWLFYTVHVMIHMPRLPDEET